MPHTHTHVRTFPQYTYRWPKTVPLIRPALHPAGHRRCGLRAATCLDRKHCTRLPPAMPSDAELHIAVATDMHDGGQAAAALKVLLKVWELPRRGRRGLSLLHRVPDSSSNRGPPTDHGGMSLQGAGRERRWRHLHRGCNGETLAVPAPEVRRSDAAGAAAVAPTGGPPSVRGERVTQAGFFAAVMSVVTAWVVAGFAAADTDAHAVGALSTAGTETASAMNTEVTGGSSR